METQSFIEQVKKISTEAFIEEELLLENIKREIKSVASFGKHRQCFYPESLMSKMKDCSKDRQVDFEKYNKMLYYVMGKLKDEGFDISATFIFNDSGRPGLYFHVSW